MDKILASALNGLWIICGTLLFVATYLLTLDISYEVLADEDCKFDITPAASGALTCLSRSVNYVWWFFPVIYVFWPRGRCCRRTRDGMPPSKTDDI
jgi:hypothetical protein